MTAAIRHVFWDWNGTLLDDADLCRRLINVELEAQGHPALDPERYAEVFGFPVKDYYQRAGLTFDDAEFEAMCGRFYAAYRADEPGCALRHGAAEAFDAVEAAGAVQSVLSAYQAEALEAVLAHHGLRGRFQAVHGASDKRADGKQGSGRALMAALGADPSEVLMVGDTVHDHEVAEDLGIACVLIESGHVSRARLEATGRRVLGCLSEVAGLVG